MTLKGELFSTAMVQAYLEKRKIHTCRPIPKDAEVHECTDGVMVTRPKKYPGEYCRFAPLEPKYQPGDFMYCRETWQRDPTGFDEMPPENWWVYKATDELSTTCTKWRPSIHMPKEAARLFFQVPKVAIMHLGDVDEQFAIDDGFQAERITQDATVYALDKFKDFWISQYGLDAQWMWVYWTDPVSMEKTGDR